MDRPVIYAGQEQARSFDLLSGWLDEVEGLGQLLQGALGSSLTFVSGVKCTATGGTNLQLSAGRLLTWAPIDPTTYGSLPLSTAQAYVSGVFPATQVTLAASGLAVGLAQWCLIEATYSVVDDTPTDDPTGGFLLYYNSADLYSPLIGLHGNDLPQSTRRQAVSAIKLVYGATAILGAAVPPAPDAGYVPLYLILLTGGQTVIPQESILVAGPGVGANVPLTYPLAPFTTGLLNQHHLGTKGQAPKVVLTNSLEVQGVLPFDHLPPFISGKLAITAQNVFAGPASGTPALPNFRSLVWADLPGQGTEAPLTVYAGPVSGPPAVPAFRLLAQADFAGVPVQNCQKFTANGLWTCPPGISLILLSMVAGGAGGTSGTDASTSREYNDYPLWGWLTVFFIQPGVDGNGAGAGGGVHLQPVPVVPGQAYSITVGAGGAPGQPGGFSAFGTLVRAAGGTATAGGTSPLLFSPGQNPTGATGGLSLLNGYGAGGHGGQGGNIVPTGGYFVIQPDGTSIPSGVVEPGDAIYLGITGRLTSFPPTAGGTGQNGVVIIMW